MTGAFLWQGCSVLTKRMMDADIFDLLICAKNYQAFFTAKASKFIATERKLHIKYDTNRIDPDLRADADESLKRG